MAELLEAAAKGVVLKRRVVPVDLEELSSSLEGDLGFQSGALSDLLTGEIWPQPGIKGLAPGDAPDMDAEPDRWIGIWPEGSRDGWQDVAGFMETVGDQQLARRLDDTIDGSGAFARFRGVPQEAPLERDAWYAFSEDRRTGRARAWLRDDGFDATASPPV